MLDLEEVLLLENQDQDTIQENKRQNKTEEIEKDLL